MAFSATDTTRKRGGRGGRALTCFYLSTNTTWEAGQRGAGRPGRAVLAPGATDAGSTNLTIPARTGVVMDPPLARAESDGVVAEASDSSS